jgi:hypothetical protein
MFCPEAVELQEVAPDSIRDGMLQGIFDSEACAE